MVADRGIRDLAERIAGAFQPDRTILFGSHAYGTPSPDSDVDLLLVMPHEGKSWRVAADIRSRVPAALPLDLIVRSERQLAERLALGDPFVKEIVEKGKILYEAARG